MAQDVDRWMSEYGDKPTGYTRDTKFLNYLSVILASQGLCYVKLAC